MSGPAPSDFLPLHPLDFRILLVLLEGASHGYEIVKRIEAREGERTTIYPANLYRRLRAMRSRGLLADAEAPAGEDDARRRYFEVTPLGSRVAREEAARLDELVADARAGGLLGQGG